MAGCTDNYWWALINKRTQEKEARINWTVPVLFDTAPEAKSEDRKGEDSRQQSGQHYPQTSSTSLPLSFYSRTLLGNRDKWQMGKLLRRTVDFRDNTKTVSRVIEVTGIKSEAGQKHKALLLNEWINGASATSEEEESGYLPLCWKALWKRGRVQSNKHHQLAKSDVSKQHHCQRHTEFIAWRWVIAHHCCP